MAEFITKCPHCSTELQVQEEWFGMELECPACKNKFIIAAPAIVTAAVTAPQINKFDSQYKEKIGDFYNKINANKIKALVVASISFVLIVALFFIFNKEQEVDEKDLITLNGKHYFQKISNGAFSGIAIRKEKDWIQAIIHYKNGVRHGKTCYYGIGFEEEEYWKNGQMNGSYVCRFKLLASDKIFATVKGQRKNGNEVGEWTYTSFKDDEAPTYEIKWSYNDNGKLHGICQTPLFPPTRAPGLLFHKREDFFYVYPASRGLDATYAEAEFSNGARVSNGKLMKITPTGKRVEIAY